MDADLHTFKCATLRAPHAFLERETMTNTAQSAAAFDQYKIYVAGAAVTLLLVGSLSGMWLSLNHLAESISAFTGSTPGNSWFMAVTIDVMLLGAELAMIVESDEPWHVWIIPGGLFMLCGAMSVGLNVWAFVEHAPSAKQFAMEFAIALGIVLPLAIVLACLSCSKVLQKAVPLYILSRQSPQTRQDADSVADVATSNSGDQNPSRGKHYLRNKARRERARIRKMSFSEPADQVAKAA